MKKKSKAYKFCIASLPFFIVFMYMAVYVVRSEPSSTLPLTAKVGFGNWLAIYVLLLLLAAVSGVAYYATIEHREINYWILERLQARVDSENSGNGGYEAGNNGHFEVEGGGHNSSQLNHSRWPWGNYQTTNLGHLEAAARQFWVNYDPDDPSTAPTVEMVATWLRETRGVSADKAKSIASLLRADGLPAGPRR